MNENPAFGADLEPFMGIPSFMRLPVTRDLTNVDVAVMGVPFDSGTSYRSGTRFRPAQNSRNFINDLGTQLNA